MHIKMHIFNHLDIFNHLEKIIIFLILFTIFQVVSIKTIDHVENQNKIDPLSKINIKSNSAIFQKDNKKSKVYYFTYKDNVFVTFADKSTIKSDELEIKLYLDNWTDITNTNSVSDKNRTFSSGIKTINFKKNVKIKNKNKKISVNRAFVDVDKKICYLFGNVQIEQIKETEKDIPITTKCDKATLDLKTEKLTFIGSRHNPVNTTIKIEKRLFNKKGKFLR